MKNKLTKISLAFVLLLLFNGLIYAQSDLNGSVLYHFQDDKPIPGVVVTLLDAGSNVVATTVTDLNGCYVFPAVPYGAYTINGSSANIPGGANLADAQKVRQHLEGSALLNPIEALAADVALPAGIGWEDYYALIEWFDLGLSQPGNWVFEPVSFTHSGAKHYVPKMGGSSAGDVNGTFVPTTRNYKEMQVNYTEKTVSDHFTFEIFANDISEAAAMGLELIYPGSLIEITGISGQIDANITHTADGRIRISWISRNGQEVQLNPDKPVVVLEGRTSENYRGEEISIKLGNESHFSNVEGNEIETRFTIPVLKANSTCLGVNYPNPFSGNTNIEFTVPSDGKVTISLFSTDGKLVKVVTEGYMSAGNYLVNVEAGNLKPGIYYYSLKTDGKFPVNETRKMIITQ